VLNWYQKIRLFCEFKKFIARNYCDNTTRYLTDVVPTMKFYFKQVYQEHKCERHSVISRRPHPRSKKEICNRSKKRNLTVRPISILKRKAINIDIESQIFHFVFTEKRQKATWTENEGKIKMMAQQWERKIEKERG